MDEKPRRFRFGLIALFALIAAVGVLACFWNPFHKPNISNFGLIEVGMTEGHVRELVGKPDRAVIRDGLLIHGYTLGGYLQEGVIWYSNGRVVESEQYRIARERYRNKWPRHQPTVKAQPAGVGD